MTLFVGEDGQCGAGGSCALDTQHQPHQLAAALPVFSTGGAAGQGGAGGSCALNPGESRACGAEGYDGSCALGPDNSELTCWPDSQPLHSLEKEQPDDTIDSPQLTTPQMSPLAPAPPAFSPCGAGGSFTPRDNSPDSPQLTIPEMSPDFPCGEVWKGMLDKLSTDAERDSVIAEILVEMVSKAVVQAAVGREEGSNDTMECEDETVVDTSKQPIFDENIIDGFAFRAFENYSDLQVMAVYPLGLN